MEEGEEFGWFCPKGHGRIVDIRFGLLISSGPPSNPPEPQLKFYESVIRKTLGHFFRVRTSSLEQQRNPTRVRSMTRLCTDDLLTDAVAGITFRSQ